MESLHEYVPTHSTLSKVSVPGGDEEIDVMKDKFHQILFGGDQLTAARARGSQRICKNSEGGKERLEGLMPVCEDWHSNLYILGVRCMLTKTTHTHTHTFIFQRHTNSHAHTAHYDT